MIAETPSASTRIAEVELAIFPTSEGRNTSDGPKGILFCRGKPMHEPRISLVTPSYQQADYLEETLCSVLDQGYPQLEYWVIDGGSTDRSVDIIRKYERYLAGWISKRDRGQAHALNKGFAAATGDVFGYLNSDDRLEPGALACVGEQFARGAQWIAGRVRNFGHGHPDDIWEYPEVECRADRWFFFFANPIHQPGSFWSARLGRRFGSFNESLHMVFDYDLFMRFRYHADLLPTRIDRVLAAFRLHPGSKTMAQQQRFEEEFEVVRQEFLRSLNPTDGRQARQRMRWLKADRMQAQALVDVRAGQRRAAWKHFWRSIRLDPGLLGRRRTAGAFRTLLWG